MVENIRVVYVDLITACLRSHVIKYNVRLARFVSRYVIPVCQAVYVVVGHDIAS